MKYKILSEDMVKNLVEFLDEVQFDAAKENTTEDMHKGNLILMLKDMNTLHHE